MKSKPTQQDFIEIQKSLPKIYKSKVFRYYLRTEYFIIKVEVVRR